MTGRAPGWAWASSLLGEADLFPESGTGVTRVVAVPWIYGGDPPLDDIDRVADARERLESALTDDEPTAVVATPGPTEVPLVPMETQVPTDAPYPFPPEVRPEALAPEPGIQTWMQWWSWDGPEQLLELRRHGFVWFKQRFAWKDMEPFGPGAIDGRHASHYVHEVKRVTDHGPGSLGMGANTQYRTKLLVQLDVPPEWARVANPVPGQPPFDLQAWETFVHNFAVHYAGEVDAYEVMNEPNLLREWGAAPDPAAYAAALRAAYRAIKTADPMVTVISAGLAPTATDMPTAMGDVEFLEGLYTAMQEDEGSWLYFDALGAHAPGFAAPPWAGPEEVAADPRLGGNALFTFRHIETLRDVMTASGDEEKQVVVTEFGWTTDPRRESPYHWMAVTPEERREYIASAYSFAVDSYPWLGPMILFSARDPAWTDDDEASYWAVTDREQRLLPELEDLHFPEVTPPTAP